VAALWLRADDPETKFCFRMLAGWLLSGFTLVIRKQNFVSGCWLVGWLAALWLRAGDPDTKFCFRMLPGCLDGSLVALWLHAADP
jgi:hypothetical protein